jgi:hypothetical protein
VFEKPPSYAFNTVLFCYESHAIPLFFTFWDMHGIELHCALQNDFILTFTYKFYYISVTPNITVYCPNATTLTKGDNFTCVCRGEGGNPPAVVTWYKDGEQIVTGTEIAILSLINVDEDDRGTYRCEARSHKKAKKEIIIEIIVNCKYIIFLCKTKEQHLYVTVNYFNPIMHIESK